MNKKSENYRQNIIFSDLSAKREVLTKVNDIISVILSKN